MKTRKSYRLSPRSVEALEKLKVSYPTWTETDLIEAAIESLIITDQMAKVYPDTPLDMAALSAAQDYYSAATFKTPQVKYHEGKAKALINYAADIHQGDTKSMIEARRLTDEADEIMTAAETAAKKPDPKKTLAVDLYSNAYDSLLAGNAEAEAAWRKAAVAVEEAIEYDNQGI